jgi:excinuclease ABC subunit C
VIFINYVLSDGKVTLTVFQVFHGRLADKEEFTFDFYDGFLDEFLVQYYSDRTPPSVLILPQPVDKSLAQFLSMKKGSRVDVTIPLRGEKKQLLDLVMKNIEIVRGKDQIKSAELQRILRLPNPPAVIEWLKCCL